MSGIGAAPGDVVVLVGTSKGLFALTPGPTRDSWSMAGPWFPGEEIYAAVARHPGRSQPAAGRGHQLALGAVGVPVRRPRRLVGRARSARTLAFPDDTGAAVARVWQLQPAADGAARRGLRRGRAGGAVPLRRRGRVVRLDEGLWNHPHRPQWQPGRRRAVPAHGAARPRRAGAAGRRGLGGRLLPHPRRTHVGGGQRRHRGPVPAPTRRPSSASACTRSTATPSQPDTLFLQHHWGVYRSDDFGGTWDEVGADSLPSTFGFPIVADPNRPGHGLRAAAHVRHVPVHPRRAAPGLPHHRRRRVVGRRWPTGCPRRTPT